MFEYICPKCGITTKTDENIVHIDEDNIRTNEKRKEYNEQIDVDNLKIGEKFLEEMEKVKKECLSLSNVKDIKIFVGDKYGYEIRKPKDFVSETYHPSFKSHSIYLPVLYVKCPACGFKKDI